MHATKNALTLPQVRVLRAVAGGPLTRQAVCRKAGFAAGSGTLGVALRGRGGIGLIDAGMITRSMLDVENGLVEVSYAITAKGKRALAKAAKRLPKIKSKLTCTNLRYKGEMDVQEEQGRA